LKLQRTKKGADVENHLAVYWHCSKVCLLTFYAFTGYMQWGAGVYYILPVPLSRCPDHSWQWVICCDPWPMWPIWHTSDDPSQSDNLNLN